MSRCWNTEMGVKDMYKYTAEVNMGVDGDMTA